MQKNINYLDLGFDILDGITGLDLESDGLASQGLDEDLHTSPQSEDKMEGRLLLDVVIGQRPAVLQLFTGEDQPLLVWRDSLLVLKIYSLLNIFVELNIVNEVCSKLILISVSLKIQHFKCNPRADSK